MMSLVGASRIRKSLNCKVETFKSSVRLQWTQRRRRVQLAVNIWKEDAQDHYGCCQHRPNHRHPHRHPILLHGHIIQLLLCYPTSYSHVKVGGCLERPAIITPNVEWLAFMKTSALAIS